MTVVTEKHNRKNWPTQRRIMLAGILVLSLGIAETINLWAQEAAVQAAPPSKKKLVPIHWKADKASNVSATGIQTLAGNVIFTSENSVMRTALAQYSDKTGTAVAPGTIQIDDERNTLVGNKGTAYYKSHKAIIEGAVKIVVRPKKGSASAPKGSVRREFKDPVTVFCDRVDYDWKTRIAVATGNLTLKQVTSEGVTRTVTAKELRYYAKEERLVLAENVNAIDSKGQKLTGPLAVAIIREGAEEFTMERGASATLLIEEDDEPTPTPTPLLPAPVATPAVPTTPPKTPPDTAPPVPTNPTPTPTPTLPKGGSLR